MGLPVEARQRPQCYVYPKLLQDRQFDSKKNYVESDSRTAPNAARNPYTQAATPLIFFTNTELMTPI